MNKRMHAIVKYIEPGRGLIDVGTDHGYLPTWMASHGYHGNIIAADINAAPLQKARENAEKAGVTDRITFQLCDGLEQCKPESVDTIIIAGMGGDLICRILDLAEWCMDRRYKLILQPMTKSEVLRYWLTNNEFEILAEDLARRDMDDVPIDESNYEELASRIDAYISEFEEHGTDNILVDSDIM